MATDNIKIKLLLDGKEFTAELDRASGNVKQFADTQKSGLSSVLGVWGKVTVAVAAVGAAYLKMGKLAMDEVEQETKFGVVFANSIDAANRAVTNLTTNYGMARTEARELLSATGDLLTGFGMQSDMALELSQRTQTLAADLVSFTNYAGGVSGASEAITKAMLGEREMLKSLGIVIREADIDQELVRQGMQNTTGEARLQAVAIATLDLAYRQSTNAIGDFARSADSPANVARRMQSALQDMGEEIGATLLPGFQELGLAFINASRDGGVFVQAAKAIGEALSLAGMSLAYFIRSLNAISTSNQLQDNLNATAAATGAAQVGLSRLNREMEGVRRIGFSTATSYREMVADLDRIGQGNDARAQAARNISTQLQTIRAEVDRNLAIGQAHQNQTITQTQSYEQQHAELQRLANRIRGITSETDAHTTATRAQTRAQQEQTANVEAQNRALEQMRKAYQSITQKFTDESSVAGIYREQREAVEQLDRALAANAINSTQHQTAVALVAETTARRVREAYTEMALGAANQVSGMVSQLGQLYSMHYANQQANLDNEYQQEYDQLSARYAERKAQIEATVTDETAKAAALKALDEQRAREEKALEEKKAKELLKLKREAAKREKQISIFETTLAIPDAAYKAYKALAGIPIVGPALGTAAAAAATALGLAKLKLINDTPLPEAASGGYSDTPAIFGERGPELAFPLTSDRGRNAMALMADTMLDRMGREQAQAAPIFNYTINVHGSIVDRQGFVDGVVDAITAINQRTGAHIGSTSLYSR